MNWYKKSQQQTFDFWSDEDQRHQYLDKRPQSMLPTPEMEEGWSFEEAIEDAGSIQEVFNILKFYAPNYEIIDFPNKEKIISVNDHGHLKIIDISRSSFEVEDPQKWLQDITWSDKVWQYVDARDFSEEFWDGIGAGYTLYHGTTEENAEKILKHGLNPGYETRGINNRNTGAAVFTSDEQTTAESYYDVVFAIDIGAMKADGYMPKASMEEPVQEAEWENALAHKIGLEDYESEYEQGLDPGTVIFYGNIPPKYLKVVKS